MSIEDKNIVDMVGIDKKSGNAILTIADHLDWSDTMQHLEDLQEKINSYLRFCESGEITRNYPNAIGKKIEIHIVGKYDLPTQCIDFIKKANEIVNKELNISIIYQKICQKEQ